VALLGAYGAWRLLSPGPQDELERAVAPIPVPVPQAPSPPAVPDEGDSAQPAAAPDTGAPTTGSVWFDETLPLDARVLVDNQEVTVPASGMLSLPPGTHTVRVVSPGFRPTTASARVAAGETDTLRIRLAPVPSTPVTLAPAQPPAVATQEPPSPAPSRGSESILVIGELLPGAEVTLDGKAVPAGQREIPASAGVHWLKVSALGYRPDSTQVEVSGGARASWQVPQLTPLPRPEPIFDVAIVTQDTSVQAGSSVQLRATVTSETGGRVDEPVRWESTNPEVAGVEANGRVIGRGPGRTYVRASTRNDADSIAVTVSAKPAPPLPASEGRATPSAVPAAPTAPDLDKAVAACMAALGSGNERQIVETYQAKTARDVSNLRKLLDVALRPEAELTAAEVKRGVAAPVAQNVEIPLQLRFTWRNNAGVNRKKEAAFRLALSRTSAGWRLASCRAEEKLGF
jgi:Bacterial Ig-like domain (group 2)/PEGA domain